MHAVKKLSLGSAPGETLGLIGDNGAGKSTLIKILSGLHAPDAGEVVAGLEADGHAVLEDLTFATGSSELGEGTFASLSELGAWLAENPAVLIGIVGHTDAVGGLDANIALSKRRAESVAARLVSTYGIDRSRIEALGAGYLSPRATNQTEEGREANRRVEVILTAVQ